MTARVSGILLVAIVTVLLSPPTLMAADKTLHIAMVLWRGETDAEKGFKTGLQELGYTVTYSEFDAKQDKSVLGGLLRSELQPKLHDFAYIYTYGTTVSQAAHAIINNRVPQIFSNVADPVGAGLVSSLDSPGANLSGTTNNIPLDVQIREALKVVSFKRLGLFFNPQENNSVLIRQHLQEIATKLGFEVIDLRSPPAQEMLEKNLQKLADKSITVDAVYLPLDSHLITQAKLLGPQLQKARIKSIGSFEGYIKEGVLLGLVPDFYALGKAAAAIVDRHQKGEQLQQIPVARDQEPTFMINQTTARLLDVKVPEELLKKAIVVE